MLQVNQETSSLGPQGVGRLREQDCQVAARTYRVWGTDFTEPLGAKTKTARKAATPILGRTVRTLAALALNRSLGLTASHLDSYCRGPDAFAHAVQPANGVGLQLSLDASQPICSHSQKVVG
jgi:hypothetical protein